MNRKLPKAIKPPDGAWSRTRDLGPFHPDSHFCSHCKGEIPPGDKLAHKLALVFCMACFGFFFPVYRN